MKIYDIEKISTHGGSLRIFGCHSKSKREINKTVEETLSEEINFEFVILKPMKVFRIGLKKLKIIF